MSSTERTYGIGIVGCGVIAPFHARSAQSLPNATLRAVMDIVPEAAQKRAEEFGVEAYTDLDAMLARPDIDIICVCVPSGLHAEIGIRAAQARKHVLVEKPIDITLEAADRLIDACHEYNVKLGVISQHRFGAGMVQLREALDAGRFGKLILGDAIIKWYRTQGYYDSGDWRGTWALDGGGALMNQGVHYVDQLQWTMGPVKSIYAKAATAAHTIEVEDIVLAILTFENGAIGTVEASTAVYPGLPERLEITGTEGTAVIEAGRVKIWEFKDEKGEANPYGTKVKAEEAPAATGSADPAAIPSAGHRTQLANLIASIEGDATPAITGEDARRPLEIILAIYESARTGREVTLPLGG